MASPLMGKLVIDTSAVTRAIDDLNSKLKTIGAGVKIDMDGILNPVNSALTK